MRVFGTAFGDLGSLKLGITRRQDLLVRILERRYPSCIATMVRTWDGTGHWRAGTLGLMTRSMRIPIISQAIQGYK